MRGRVQEADAALTEFRAEVRGELRTSLAAGQDVEEAVAPAAHRVA